MPIIFGYIGFILTLVIMKRGTLFCAVAGMLIAPLARAQEFEQQWLVPNGQVNTVVKDTANNLVYIGGSFNYIGPKQSDAVSKGAVLNANTGAVNLLSAKPDNYVSSVISDGQGGWYIMGSFSSVGGQPRQGLAQVNSAGEVTPFFAKGVTQKIDYPYVSDPTTALALRGNTVYIGGNYKYVGPLDRYGTTVSLATGSRNASFPVLDGGSVATPDGLGGWFIGGSFHHVGGLERNGLAWVAADGTVKEFDPGTVSGTVSKLILYGSTLYVGGSFSSIGGVPRNHLAAIDINTGLVTDWDPDAQAGITHFSLLGTTLYVGGRFSSLGGVPRSNLAAFNVQTGELLSWAPMLTYSSLISMTGLAATDDHVYFSGYFNTVNGVSRQNIASVDPVTAELGAWAPTMDGYITSMTASATRLYVGGDFTNVAGSARIDIVAFDLATGILTSWNPGNNVNKSVQSIQVKDGDVFVQSRNQADDFTYPLVRYNEASGQKLNWTAGPVLGAGNVLVAGDSELYLGGQVYSVGGIYGEAAVALDATTGDVKQWMRRPLNRMVRSIVVSGNTVYMSADDFGSPRYDLAAFNATTGELLPWSPADVWGQVNTLAVQGDKVVAGGSFTQVGTKPRQNIAYFDALSGGLQSSGMNQPNGAVLTLRAKGDTLYMGGLFTQVGSTARNYAAALTTSPISMLAWDPQPDAKVTTLDLQGDKVFLGGWFTHLGGADRLSIGKVDGSTGAALPWEAQANYFIRSVAVSGNKVYAGGDFTSIGGVTRRNIAAFDGTTGRPTQWNPDANGAVRAIVLNEGSVFAGGDFTTMGGQPRAYIAAINPLNGYVRPWDAHVDGIVRTIISQGSALYFGGDFAHVGGASRSNAASVWSTGAGLRNWNPSVNGPVYAMGSISNRTILGGIFSSVGGAVRNNIAAVGTGDGAVTAWDPNADGAVYTILPDVDAIFIGGQFGKMNGKTRNRFAALNPYTGKAMYAWNLDFGAHPTHYVDALAKYDTTLYAGGKFDNVNSGPTRYNLAAIGMGTKTITSFDVGPIRAVKSMDLADGKLYLGFGESTYTGAPYNETFGVVGLGQGLLRTSGPLAQATVELQATLMPNPSVGQQVKLTVIGIHADVRDAVIRVMSLDGKLISTERIAVEEGNVRVGLPGSESWSAGIYLVQLTAGSQTHTQRLVVTE